MKDTGRHGHRGVEPDDIDRREAIGGGTIAELAIRVVPPAAHGARELAAGYTNCESAPEVWRLSLRPAVATTACPSLAAERRHEHQWTADRHWVPQGVRGAWAPGECGELFFWSVTRFALAAGGGGIVIAFQVLNAVLAAFKWGQSWCGRRARDGPRSN